jgi:hypothetical protein
VPRPQFGASGNGRRDFGPMHKPHPAKPRVHPVSVPGKVPNNGNAVNGNQVNSNTVKANPVNGNKPGPAPTNQGNSGRPAEGGNNGKAPGNPDWPRSEFRSPDSSAG